MNDKDKQELDGLNTAVDLATEERTKWLDDKMPEYADIAIGEDIYDISSGRRLGTVSRHYRYHAGDLRFDTELSINYEYETSKNCFDNTSRQIVLNYGTKNQASKYLDSLSKALS